MTQNQIDQFEETGPSLRTLFMRVGTWGRPMALFLGGFSLLNILGEIRYPGFDANIWWIDLWFLNPSAGKLFLVFASIFLLAFAIMPSMCRLRKHITFIFILLLYLACIFNVIVFYSLLVKGRITTSIPVPLSLFISMACEVVGIPIIAGAAKVSRRKQAVLFVMIPLGGIFLFPVAQMFFFGRTDYARKADAVVVFGAGVYKDGTPSTALSDRTRTGCQLYLDGYTKWIIFSGGPGPGATHETEAMRKIALDMGIPDEAIIIDPEGLSTQQTVVNTCEIFEGMHITRVLAVSHFYHLPRIKMTYQRQNMEVYTVPAKESRVLAKMPIFILREIAAIMVYYVRPLVP